MKSAAILPRSPGPAEESLSLPLVGNLSQNSAKKDAGQAGMIRVAHTRRTRNFLILSLFTIHYLLFTASDAFAMHISEGLLPFNWAAFWFGASAPFVGYGLYRLKKLSSVDLSFKPLVGLMAAVVFVISCMPIPVPTAGTCSHPCGTGISGILLGPSISVIVAAAALLIQALFLSHGGLSTLGANIFSMGIVGSFTGFGIFRLLRAFRANLFVAGFIAGVLADWATYMATSVELASGIRGDSPFLPLFFKILVAFIPTQLPLGILEGVMTAGMISLLYKKRPDLLVKMRVLKPRKAAL
jgi:cobalt/nickel transport system permease protein